MSPLPTNDQIDAGGKFLSRVGIPSVIAILLLLGVGFGGYKGIQWGAARLDTAAADEKAEKADLQKRIDAKDAEIRELTTNAIASTTAALNNNTAAMEATVKSNQQLQKSVDELGRRFDQFENAVRMGRLAEGSRPRCDD